MSEINVYNGFFASQDSSFPFSNVLRVYREGDIYWFVVAAPFYQNTTHIQEGKAAFDAYCNWLKQKESAE